MTPLETAGQIAEQLPTDPVWIDPGAAHLVPDATVEHIRETVDEAPVDVYVVIAHRDVMGDSPFDFTTLIQAQTDAEGVYLITTPDGYLSYDVRIEDSDAARDASARVVAGRDAVDEPHEGLSELTDILDQLASDAPVPERNSSHEGAGTVHVPPPPPPSAPQMLSPDMVALGVFLAAIGAGMGAWWLWRRGQAARAARPTYTLPTSLLANAAKLQQSQMRRGLGDDALHIAERLAQLDTQTLSAEDAETVAHGLDAYDLARRIVDDETSDRADLAGALVLMTIAGHDVARVERAIAQKGSRLSLGRGAPAKVADIADLCTIDPAHGTAAERKRPDGAEASVPVCRDCARDLAAGRRPQWLVADGKPYAEGDSVWARTLYGTTGGDLVSMLQLDYGRRAR